MVSISATNRVGLIGAIVFIALGASVMLLPNQASAAAVTALTSTATSSNASTTLAKVDDVIYINLKLSGTPAATTSPVISVLNLGTTTMSGGGVNWTYSTTSASGWTEGNITYTIDSGGTLGEATTTVLVSSASTTITHVVFDKTAPSAPTADPAEGTYTQAQSVSLTSSGSATVRYTIDDTAPTCTTGTLYSSSFGVASAVVRAVGCDDASNISSVATFTFARQSGGGGGGSRRSTTVSTMPTAPASGSGLGSSQVSAILDLLRSFNADQSVIDQVNASLSGQASAGAAGSASGSFSRDLEVGSVGEDVRALQVFLNGHGFPVVADGPGSAGNETTSFGSLTKAALAKFQAAKGITPAVGYFGPKTRAAVSGM